MDALEALFRPITSVLNRNIAEITPARELAARLGGKVIAVRVQNTALALYFTMTDEKISLSPDCAAEPDVVISGSLLTLALISGSGGETAMRDGSLHLTGSVAVANDFQELLRYARPDVEEELAGLVGDAAAHRLGEFARGVADWTRETRHTMAANIREYLQEESRDAPSRYELERFSRELGKLRDDVDRIEARLRRVAGKR